MAGFGNVNGKLVSDYIYEIGKMAKQVACKRLDKNV